MGPVEPIEFIAIDDKVPQTTHAFLQHLVPHDPAMPLIDPGHVIETDSDKRTCDALAEFLQRFG